MSAFSKVQRGDRVRPFTATEHNAVVDAARQVRAGRFSQLVADDVPAAPYGTILVKNNTVAAIPRFGVLAISSVLFDPADNAEEFENRPCLVGVSPTGSLRNFVVLQEPLAPGAIGVGLAHGITPVTLSVGVSATTYNFADMTALLGVTALSAVETGQAEILWRAGGTGLQQALVRLSMKPPEEA